MSSSIRYRTIDLVVVVMIGVVAGVAFFGYAALIGVLRPVTNVFPPSEGVYAGLWALPGALSMLIVRKPGAALGAMWIGALIEAALGSHFGWTVLVSGALVASGFEVMGALTKYARPALSMVIVGAMISMGVQWVWEQFIFFDEWSIAFRLVHLVLFTISGIVLLAIPAPTIVDALARAGALNSFPAARERA